jgi:hypothetical protein
MTELSYESREPGALLPGEALLWEQPPRKSGRPPLRVTDRRLIGAQVKKSRKAVEAPVDNIAWFSMTLRRKRTLVTLEPLSMTNVRDPAGLASALIALPLRSGRRARNRRSGYHHAHVMDLSRSDRSNVPREIFLQPDEQILWSGWPRKWAPLDRVWRNQTIAALLWMLIPIGFVIGWRMFNAHVGFAIFAMGWIALTLYAIFISPIVAARRRARTKYFLTNVRAITFVDGRPKQVHSVFLDLCRTASYRERSLEGLGDVTADPQLHFELVADARQLHTILLRAIREAGTPSSIQHSA